MKMLEKTSHLLISVECRTLRGGYRFSFPICYLLFLDVGKSKEKQALERQPLQQSNVEAHVQPWYRMCLEFTGFFSFGKTYAFPNFLGLRNQAPACAEPSRGLRQGRVPQAGDCSCATCLTAGKTACRNWKHFSDSHILGAASASTVTREAEVDFTLYNLYLYHLYLWIQIQIYICIRPW